MANPYNANQQWTQNQMHYEPQQMNQNYDYSPQNGQGQQQQQLDPNAFVDPNAYFGNVQQQQVPQNPQPNTSPPLHGGFNMSQPNNNVQQSQGGMGGGFTFGAQQHSSPPLNRSAGAPYRTAPTNFNFSTVGSGPAATSAQGPSVHNTPANLFQNQLPQASGSSAQHQQNYYNNDGGEPISKRHHGLAFDPNQESDEIITQEQKDAKAKLSRACARCKNLKVRCEAKTETEPCIRCYKAGQECVTPGRKIRRTPPKREHLIAEIHSQKEKIEGLLRRLEELEGTGGKANGKRPDDGRLTPTSTGGSFYDESETGNTSQDMDGDNTFPESGHAASGSNKAVEEWIAKARESLHEFGAFVGIGGAGMPKSYLVGEDFEDSDDDQEYTDAPEELEGEADDDRIGVAVEAPEGEEMPYDPTRPTQANSLRHKSSSSSMGTVGTSNTANTGLPRPPKRNGANNDNAKSASIPVEASPFGLFGKLSLVGGPRSRAGSAEPEEEDRGAGIAREDFFKSTPAPNALGRRLESAQHQTPTILTRGIITPQEAEALFKIYFENMNLSVSLLDPVLYTAQRTFYRSPFLFTVICAIASRFYSPRPDLYAKIMQQAQHAAGMALISGNKNVEMCQAYILLSLYPVPARKWEDQRSWLYLGLAIRTATDLNLHLPTTAKPLNENHAREMLNRTRVWMNCLNLDRSTGSQYGKPPIISPRDYIANHSDRWWATSPYNIKHFDIQICAYNAELKVMTAFIAKIYSDPDHPTGLNKEVDFEGIATETDDELKALAEKWFAELDQTDMSDPQNSFRTGLLRLAFSYSRLVALSYGFQHAFGKTDGVDENPFLMRCLKAASDVVDSVVNDICRPEQLHYFRHGPEAQSVFVTFASAFLVKLLQPKFASYLTPETRVEIRTLVQSVIDLLGSPAVAIDDRHGPKLYSRFLAKLLAKPMARINPLSPGPGSTASAYVPLPRIRQATYPVTSPSAAGSTRSQRSLPPATFDSSTFTIPATVYNHPSPETSNSLSPPATESALSFESFAPTGPTDPFATETAAAVAASSASAQNINNMMMEGFFQPSLPFDDHIVQSLQSLTDPSGWQDISLPGFNWMAQFQQNFGLDLNNGTVYDQNMDFNYNPGANGPAGQ